ncbi:MAG: radical SAM protein [Syntrophales bacterium]|nr:radical SAM protein [Syntrophales bacterium]
MKVLIAIPKQELGQLYADKCFWSRGALQIAHYLKQTLPDVHVKIVDCILLDSDDDISRYLDGIDVLGISILSSYSYRNGLKIAEIAKRKGVKKVVLGGNHVTTLAENVLRNQDTVDAIIRGKGEIAFAQFVRGDAPETIRNLVWRKNGEIVSNGLDTCESDSHPLHLDNLPFLDYSLIELDKYWENHGKAFNFLPAKVYMTLTHEGCTWREKSNGCSFCALTVRKRLYRDPKKVWDEILTAHKLFGIEYVKDFGDTITGDTQWLKDFLKTRPAELQDMPFWPYAKTSEVDEETALLLKELNVKCVLIGYESNSDRQLKIINKGTSAYLNLRATELFGKYGIVVFASYILGSRGETEESMKETYDFAEQILNVADVRMSGGSPLAVLPGSQDWFDLIEREPKYQKVDVLDFNEVEHDWLKHFCRDLGPPEEALDKIMVYCKKINTLSPLNYRFGWD